MLSDTTNDIDKHFSPIYHQHHRRRCKILEITGNPQFFLHSCRKMQLIKLIFCSVSVRQAACLLWGLRMRMNAADNDHYPWLMPMPIITQHKHNNNDQRSSAASNRAKIRLGELIKR